MKFREILWRNTKPFIVIMGGGFALGLGMAWFAEYVGSLVNYEPFGLVVILSIFSISILVGFVKSIIEYRRKTKELRNEKREN